MQGRVTVYGSNVVRPPLCDDPDAKMVVIRNAAGDPILVLVRLNGDTWGMSTPDDKDWSEVCIRFGILPPRSMASVLSEVAGSH